jgi:transcriptional regulator with XRE-family HTH domain
MYSASTVISFLPIPFGDFFPDHHNGRRHDCASQPSCVLFPNMGRNKMADEQIGTRIAERRESHGWSQADLSKLLKARGVSVYPNMLHKIERGDRAIRVDELSALATVFGISVDTLLGRRIRSASADVAFALHAALRATYQGASQAYIAGENMRDRAGDLITLIGESDPDYDRLVAVAHQIASAADVLDKASEATRTLGDDIAAIGKERTEK